MNNLDDIKKIWLSVKTDSLPDAEDMLHLVKKFRNQKLQKKWLIIAFSFVLMLFWIINAIVFKPAMLSTQVGEACAVIALIILATTNLRSLKRFYQLNGCSNKEFIAFLEQTRYNQLYYYKKTQVAGMASSTLALILYMYEFVKADMVLLLITYIVILGILLILWFVIRPRNFTRQSKKMNELIQRTQIISKQLEQ